MDSSDVVALIVGITVAGAIVYAFEKGYLKIPTTTMTSVPTNSSTSNSTVQTTTNTQTTSNTFTQTSSSSPGTVTGIAVTGNGSSSSTSTFTSSPPSGSSSTSSTNSSSTSSTNSSSTSSTNSSSTSSTNSSSTVPTNSSGSGSYPSSSGGSGNVAPPTSSCAVQCGCPQGISGQCYCPNCSCYTLNNVTLNNNYGTSVQIVISSEYVQYCNSTQGVTWIAGTIQPGQYNINLPVAPSTSVGGAIYVYPPNGANNNYPYVLNYEFVNSNQVMVVKEVDLASTMSVTVTNNTQYNIVLSNVSNLFNNQKVIIAPGQSGSINVGNGWIIGIGTTDPFENFPSSNPAPTACFNQFVIVNGQPAINFINDQDYDTCSQYNYTLTINGNTYNGNMGQGLNYNVETVNTSGGSSSSSSSSSSSNSTSTTVSNPVYGHIYGGVRPKIVPY